MKVENMLYARLCWRFLYIVSEGGCNLEQLGGVSNMLLELGAVAQILHSLNLLLPALQGFTQFKVESACFAAVARHCGGRGAGHIWIRTISYILVIWPHKNKVVSSSELSGIKERLGMMLDAYLVNYMVRMGCHLPFISLEPVYEPFCTERVLYVLCQGFPLTDIHITIRHAIHEWLVRKVYTLV